jgi:hypothetical protein
VIKAPVRAPRARAHAERWVGSIRRVRAAAERSRAPTHYAEQQPTRNYLNGAPKTAARAGAVKEGVDGSSPSEGFQVPEGSLASATGGSYIARATGAGRRPGCDGPDQRATPQLVGSRCLPRHTTRVRTRVKDGLQTPQLTATRCSLDSRELQHVSVSRSSVQLVEPDFNPKVVGSIPTRPIQTGCKWP